MYYRLRSLRVSGFVQEIGVQDKSVLSQARNTKSDGNNGYDRYSMLSFISYHPINNIIYTHHIPIVNIRFSPLNDDHNVALDFHFSSISI